LKENLPVGGSWIETSIFNNINNGTLDTTRTKYTIIAKAAFATVNGVIFSDVIKISAVTVPQSIYPTDPNYYSEGWLARGVGKIRSFSQDSLGSLTHDEKLRRYKVY